MNSVLKQHLNKISVEVKETSIPHCPLPSFAFSQPLEPSILSPFELMYDRPFLLESFQPPLALWVQLPPLSLPHQPLSPQTPPDSPLGPPPELGDCVFLQAACSAGTLEPKWTGPPWLLLTTSRAAQLWGCPFWVHSSKLKRDPTPQAPPQQLVSECQPTTDLPQTYTNSRGTVSPGPFP